MAYFMPGIGHNIEKLDKVDKSYNFTHGGLIGPVTSGLDSVVSVRTLNNDVRNRCLAMPGSTLTCCPVLSSLSFN